LFSTRRGVAGWWRSARFETSWVVLVDAAGLVRDRSEPYSTWGEMNNPVPGSPFEREFLQFLKRRSLPLADRQVPIYDGLGNFVARVDFAYPDLKVAIECDSKKHHFGRANWESDVERRSRLAALGWLVIHISWDMLVNRPDELEALIRGALGQPSLLDQ